MEEELKGFDREILSLHGEVEALLKDINGKEERYLAQIRAIEKDLLLKNREFDKQAIEFNQTKNELAVHTEKQKQKLQFDLNEQVASYEKLMEKFAQKEKTLFEQIKDLKSQNFDKSSHIKKLDNTISEINDLNNALTKDLEKENKKGAEREINVQNLKAVSIDKKNEVKKLWKLLDEEKKLLSRKDDEIQEKEEEINKLADKTDEAQKKYERINDVSEAYKKEKEKAILSAQDTAFVLQGKEEEIKKLSRIKENFEVELKKLNNCIAKGEQGFYYKIEILKKEVQEKDRVNADLERKVNQYSSQSEINANELSKIGKTAENLKLEIFDKTEALKAKEREVKELKNKVELLTSQMSQDNKSEKEMDVMRHKTEVIDNLNRKIAILTKEMKNQREEYNDAFKEKSEEREKISSKLVHKEQEVINLRAKLSTLERELGELSEKWKFDSAQLQNAASHLRSVNAEMEILKAKISSLESELDNYKEIASQSKEAMISLTDYGKKAENEKIAEISGILKKEMEKYNDLLMRFDKSNLTAEGLSAKKASLTGRLNNLTVENKHLKENLSAIEAAKDSEIEKLLRQISRGDEEFNKKLNNVVEEDRRRYQDLTKEMRDASINLTQKEMELQESHSALSIIKGEYDAVLNHEREISERFAEELSSENTMLEDAKRKIESKDKESEKLLDIIKSLKEESFNINKEYAVLKISTTKLNLKGVKKTEKDALLKKSEKELKKREIEIINLHEKLDKLKTDKSELISNERQLKISFSEKPYRRQIKEAERKLIEKEHKIQNLVLKLGNIENEFGKLKENQNAISSGYARSSGNLEDLVAGISHQISNSISIIRSHAEFCLEAPEKQKIKESLKAIVRSIIGLQKKIEEISNFSRPGIMQRKTAYLEAVIKDAVVFLREREDFENIKVSISCAKNLKSLKVDYVRLQEAVEYILLNAVEAMSGKGEIRIELKCDNKQQMIKISDKGCGIESRNLSTVFQPFFTTKPGKIGLGLAIAMNIARAHNGDIKINSELGRGTELILLVPEGK